MLAEELRDQYVEKSGGEKRKNDDKNIPDKNTLKRKKCQIKKYNPNITNICCFSCN